MHGNICGAFQAVCESLVATVYSLVTVTTVFSAASNFLLKVLYDNVTRQPRCFKFGLIISNS